MHILIFLTSVQAAITGTTSVPSAQSSAMKNRAKITICRLVDNTHSLKVSWGPHVKISDCTCHSASVILHMCIFLYNCF